MTSGTVFHKHKISLRQILKLLMHFESSAKGTSVLAISRKGYAPKTAAVFLGKMRESLVKAFDFSKLTGVVHMDGGYFCGKPRKPNRRQKVTTEQLNVRYGKKTPKPGEPPWKSAGMTQANWERRKHKRVIVVLSASAGPGKGSRRSIPLVCYSENQGDAIRLARRFIDPNAIVMTDESPAFSPLAGMFDHRVVSHAKEFCTSEGVNDNMCETFFSRIRRSEYGVHHGFRPKYLQDYAIEAAWRENHRSESQRTRVTKLLLGCLQMGKSDWWRGYWQGNHRPGELDLSGLLT